MGLWKGWDKLRLKGNFTPAEAREIVGGDDRYLKDRSDSSYSSILSRWEREGHLKKIKGGKGRQPATYEIAS